MCVTWSSFYDLGTFLCRSAHKNTHSRELKTLLDLFLVLAGKLLPFQTGGELTEVLVTGVTAVGPVIAHQRVRHPLHLVPASVKRDLRRESILCTKDAGRQILGGTVGLQVTGQKGVGCMVELATGHHGLQCPGGECGELDRFLHAVLCWPVFQLAQKGPVHFQVASHYWQHLVAPYIDHGTVRRWHAAGWVDGQVDSQGLVRP